MKIKLLKLLFFCFTTIFFISGCQKIENWQKSGTHNEITVFNWGELISDGFDGSVNVNEQFTKETGIKVNYKTFQNNEELFAKFSGKGSDFDVIIPSDYMIAKLIQNDMLEKINFENVPNFELIDEKFKNLSFDPENKYSIPYTWGILGLIYNKKFVSEKETNLGWEALWNEKFKGKILMFDNPRDAFAIALLKLNKSVNSDNPQDWHDAAQELLTQKHLIQAYVMDQIFDKIGNEEAYLAPYYAGDAVNIMKINKNISFSIPKNGTNMFVDSMCISKSTKNKEAAEKYINFMCRPDIAVANILASGYSTPHKIVYDLLNDDLKSNEFLYPSKKIMDNFQIYNNLSLEIGKLLDELWVEVKVGNESNSWILPGILVFFILIYVFVKLRKTSSKNKFNTDKKTNLQKS